MSSKRLAERRLRRVIEAATNAARRSSHLSGPEISAILRDIAEVEEKRA